MKGQITLEILISLFILVISISTAVTVSFGSQSVITDTQLNNQALYIARQGLESARAVSRQDFNSLVSTSSIEDIYLKETSVQDVDAYTKKVTSRVSWKIEALRPQAVEFSTIVTDLETLIEGGCQSDPLSGNWKNPRVLGSADLGPGNAGTDIAVSLPYVYLSSIASSASKPDIFVYNVSNPSSPQLLKFLDVGSGGINGIFIKGNYLYAASPNDNQELLIFDISSPANISLVKAYNLSGSADGLSVAAFGNTVAVGREESATYELVFVNVSNPSSPTIISQIATGGDIHDFYVSQKRLYLTSEESDPDIWVYNITDPLNPVFITNYDITGTTDDLSICIQQKNGAVIYAGNEENELVSINAEDILHMSVKDRIDVGGDVNDIVCVAGDLFFLATANSNKEFIIVNGSDPNNLSEYASSNFPQMATGVDYADNKVFLSVRSNDALRIITSSP